MLAIDASSFSKERAVAITRSPLERIVDTMRLPKPEEAPELRTRHPERPDRQTRLTSDKPDSGFVFGHFS